MIGDITNFGTVWYNPDSLANILSLGEVMSQCRVTLDSAIKAALIVHKKDGTTMKFEKYNNHLFYYDVAKQQTNKLDQSVSP